MRLALLPEWKRILKRAWSVRLAIAAIVFSAGEVALPFFVADMPRGLAAGLSVLCTVGGLCARLLAQPEMHK